MKGQLTIEFIMILIIMLILFNAVSMDLASSSVTDALNVQTNEITKMASITLNSTMEAFRFQGTGAKTSILLRAPSECDYLVYPGNITLNCSLGSPVYSSFQGRVIAKSTMVTFDCAGCTAILGGKKLVSGNISGISVTRG